MPDLKSELKKIVPVLGITPKPLKERVWLWVKDHPWTSAKRIAAELGEERDTISKCLVNLKYSTMVINRPSQSRMAQTNEVEWHVSPDMRGVYEHRTAIYPNRGLGRNYKARQKKAGAVVVTTKPTEKAPPAAAIPKPVEQVVQEPPATPTPAEQHPPFLSPQDLLKRLTLPEAHELWMALDTYFGRHNV